MKILITGGAGFIGVNSAYYYAKKGHKVVIFDNLSRKGSASNLAWIQSQCNVEFFKGDLRKFMDLVDVFNQNGKFDFILHLAAQVAVTTSVTDPHEDFEINAMGTFNLLEATRRYSPKATFIYSSTNKVYGEMEDLNIILDNGRYVYKDLTQGVDETRNLDFHSPYGCSKGAADQYCRDYHRIYGLKTIVLRQSCIYGYRQFGVEDQGWIAWFCIASALGKPITIYGDGKQVRDVLFIDDLIKVFDLANKNRKIAAGKIYNIGGGPDNTLSLLELIDLIEAFKGEKISLTYDTWRPGDQKIFVGNIGMAGKELGWRPKVKPPEGVKKLYAWINSNIKMLEAYNSLN
jgi:CDP-paratose 2-epimerase